MIQFLLNDEAIELNTFAPTLTVLDWLRTDMVKISTKEGCASGDCGACTVLVGELINGAWQYKTINACLMLLGNMHGKHLITVEALSSPQNTEVADLHPVQRAMVECHGSQCGFCTPGFIMSMLALYMNHDSYPGKEVVIHALSGNLCRCTGYHPILKAVKKCFSYEKIEQQHVSHKNHRFNKQVKLLTQTLERSLALNQAPYAENGQQRFYLPQTLAQLCQLKSSQPKAKLVAGATDLSVEFNQQLALTEQLISVRYCPELMQFIEDKSGMHIGAALPYSDFIEKFCQVYPEAYELFTRLGSLQVRNAGSLGGSLGNASPIGDPAPLLIALSATIEIHSIRGKRVMPLEAFYIGYRHTQLAPDEIIVAVHIPKRPQALKLSCHKISKRFEDDISAVCLVLSYHLIEQRMQQVRCVLGGMAAIPASAKQVQKALNGKPLSLENLQHAAQQIDLDFSPLSDVRASANYRLQVTKNLFERIWYQQSQHIEVIENNALGKLSKTTQTRINHAAL